MAEAPRMVDKGLDKLEKEITCGICNQHYHNPKVLPCYHYFCDQCIRRLSAEISGGRAFPCPKCEQNTSLLGGDTSQLPTAFFISGLKELHSRMSKVAQKTTAQCEMCSASRADSFCRQCAEFICDDCARSHQKMKVKFPGHEVVTLEELMRGGIQNLPHTLALAPPPTCREHGEQCKLYCFECRELICRDCILIDHAQHTYEFVTKSASQCKIALAQNLIPLKKLHGDITEALKGIETTKGNVCDQGTYVAEHVDQCFERLFEILTKRQHELLDEAERRVRQKMEDLNTQERNLEAVAAKVQRLVDFVEQNLEVLSNEELLSANKQLLHQMEEEQGRHKQLDLEPIEHANLAVNISCDGMISTICRQKAQVYLFPWQKENEVFMAEIHKETTQYVMDYSDFSHRQVKPIKAMLRSLVDGSVVKTDVVKTGKGLYEVTYCPRVRGRHSLILEVDGRPIPGSPFQTFVTIPPSQLGEPVTIIEGLRHPFAAVFDVNQQLLVSESGGHKVRIFRREGRKLVVRDFAEHRLSNPSGLAVDKNNYVYVANASNHTISKYNSEGKCVKVVGREGCQPGELNHPCGVAVIGEQVYVCDRNNNKIQIFDYNLNFIRSFGCHGNAQGQLHWPYDLVQDCEGRIYITDCDNHRIQIIEPNGGFLGSFGTRGSNKGKLKRPMGICLGTDDLLYITEYDNHRVSVFQRSGVFVTSFGKYGTKRGDLCYPVGVTVDRDGFVHVCDEGNNRIQVF